MVWLEICGPRFCRAGTAQFPKALILDEVACVVFRVYGLGFRV